MQKNIDFQEIGKNISYKVPDGFFEQVSEKTLQKAKQREQAHKKNLVFWRAVAVVTSAAAIFLFVFLIPRNDLKTESSLALQKKQPVEQPNFQQKGQIAKSQPFADSNKIETEKVPEKALPEKNIAEQNVAEDLGDVLADLSDDELMQLALMYKADPFMDDLSQEPVKIN